MEVGAASGGMGVVATHGRDLVLAAAMSLTTAAGLSVSTVAGGWWAIAGAVLVAAAVMGARRLPRLAVMLTAVPALLVSPTVWDTPFAAATVVLSYLAGRRLASDRSSIPPTAMLAAVGVAAALAREGEIASVLLLLASPLGLVVLPWLVGRTRRQRVELREAGWERAERLEQEQYLVEQQARLRERSRIAADMHDALGHELTLLALRAAGLEMAPDLSEQHRHAAAQIRADTSRATQRLGNIIGVLRSDGEEASTTPAGETVQQLIDRASASGMAVDLQSGDDLGDPGTALYRNVHRVIQESLTNAAKHATGAPVHVAIAAAWDKIEVKITNGPSLAEGSATAVAGGFGLSGLRERLRLVQGSLTAGPTSGGGFEVIASLPREPADTSAVIAESAPGRSTTAVEMAHARHRARRSLAMAIAVPAITVIAADVGVTAYWGYEMSTTVLDAATYENLQVGQDAEKVVSRLPSREVAWGPEAPQPALPEQADCRYYRSGSHPFEAEPLYRLCFDDGALVSKDVLEPPDDEAG